MHLTKGGETFYTEGHIENFSSVGGDICYICLLQLQITFQNINNESMIIPCIALFHIEIAEHIDAI